MKSTGDSFKPDIQSLIDNKDIKGILKALTHNDPKIRHQAEETFSKWHVLMRLNLLKKV